MCQYCSNYLVNFKFPVDFHWGDAGMGSSCCYYCRRHIYANLFIYWKIKKNTIYHLPLVTSTSCYWFWKVQRKRKTKYTTNKTSRKIKIQQAKANK